MRTRGKGSTVFLGTSVAARLPFRHTYNSVRQENTSLSTGNTSMHGSHLGAWLPH